MTVDEREEHEPGSKKSVLGIKLYLLQELSMSRFAWKVVRSFES